MKRQAVALGCLLVALACTEATGQEVKVVVSSKAGDRLTAKAPLHFEAARKPGGAAFKIDPSATDQKIDGFGGSLMEAGLICLNDLPPAAQEDVLQRLFDPAKGAGFSAMKTEIAATDFASAGPWYTYDDTPGDVEMKHFSIARDLGPNGMVTFIKRARKYGHFMLQAPMDYAPDWMIANLQDRKKQDVDPKYYGALALYYLRYLQEYQKQGIFIDYLSPFNEPGIYTKISYAEIRDLIRDHVGPLLEREHVKTKLQLSEAPDRHEAKNYETVLSDPVARKYIASLPYHGYDFKNFDIILNLHKKYPNLPLWMTEVCWAYEAGAPANVKLPRYDWEDGDFWGNQIFSDLQAGAAAWIYWNTILDEKGGPWAISPIHGNPDPNVQHPIVIINRGTKQVTYTGLYYYLAHFSKFVRPGAVRVGVSGGEKGVRAVAFKTPEGGFVAEVMNSNKSDVAATLEWDGRALHMKLPALSITTCNWNLK
ncbi:MAG: glycoside hydrolase family 30 beta sandwich domain-containing protein [Terriglobia bacterium]